jgi:NADH:ubiquinone oxidoreductase subunit E
MLKKIQINLCLGSSCFARGNQEIITLIKKYIEKKNIGDWVEFKGDHCFSNCSNGPNMFVGATLFQQINRKNINKILDHALAEILKHP